MEKRLFYLDSNIWLNLFKREWSYDHKMPFWKIARDFIDRVMFSEDKEIIYTGFILKELIFKIADRNMYNAAFEFISKEEKFRFVKALPKDYDFARKLEVEFNHEISFYDCLHIAVCRRIGSTLITRDSLLLKFAKKYIKVNRPEDLLR